MTHLRTRHHPILTDTINILHFLRTASKRKRSSRSTSNRTDSCRVRKTDFSKEEADTDTSGSLDSGGDQLDEPLAHASQSEKDEDETFDKDGSEGETV